MSIAATSGLEILTLKGHTNWVFSVSFSPVGKRIVSGSKDNTLKIWDACSGQEILAFKGHEYPVFGLSFSPDGKWIVSEDSNKITKVRNAESGDEIQVTEAELKAYKIVSSSSVSADKAWSVKANGSDVILISNKLRDERIA